MIRTDPPPRALDPDLDGCLRLRRSLILQAWAYLEQPRYVRSELEFFLSPRFEEWGGGGIDLTVPRERARKIAARVRREHVATMRRNQLSPEAAVRDEAHRFFRCPSSAWWLQDEGR